MSGAKQFTETQRRILALVQGDLPDVPEPFAEVARQAGASQEEVLELVRGMKQRGEIRRFGATLRHQKAGYGSNAMVAWYVDDEDMARMGAFMAARPEISHCYHRVNCMDWPYNLYTMVHAKTPEECAQTVAELARLSGLEEYDVLKSRKEFKKTSMRYF
ncbi:Lrp/AsnC family transcriptional regulator [Fundidesulfovibrio agrisoli]|uniref:siroheme decarboxylase subunit beta n=1 Tax=Fundidesulfovibrio agrisoli TaxID=2922717 RepID=UPI001FACAEA3|nr:Lrp/AsnC family transcriptional regulator [Fundidesulfovibrio agrisoli]